MQHWTLCEVLRISWDSGVRALNYIDAHAMAPLATLRDPEKPHQGSADFSRVQANLPGQRSAYECAWHTLAPDPRCGYPNSANFVTQVWKGDYSLLLCEQNGDIADDIGRWLRDINRVPRCKRTDCYVGDWRDRFRQGLPQPTEGALTFLSFDPNKYDLVGPPKYCSFDLFPWDLDLVVKALCGNEGPVLIQVSTYDRGRRNENPQCDVIHSVDGKLTRQGSFDRSAVVKADGNMMSLIYTRNVGWADKLRALGDDFGGWLDNV